MNPYAKGDQKKWKTLCNIKGKLNMQSHSFPKVAEVIHAKHGLAEFVHWPAEQVLTEESSIMVSNCQLPVNFQGEHPKEIVTVMESKDEM